MSLPSDLMQQQLLHLAQQATQHLTDGQLDAYFANTTIILSTPRAGSTLLFEQLTKQDGLWSIGNESHIIFSQFPHLKFENSTMESGCLNELHADARTARLIKSAMLFLMQNNRKQRFIDPHLVDRPDIPLFIEKTPRNALNIPFLLKLFPRAKFIYLYRDPKENIASLIEAWQVGLQTGRFAIYTQLPHWHLPAWCFLLPKGWQKMIGKSLPEITCFQWCESNQIMLEGFRHIDPSRVLKTSYEELITKTHNCMNKMMNFIEGKQVSKEIDSQLSTSKTTLTPPNPDKWRKHETAIMSLQDLWQPILNAIKCF